MVSNPPERGVDMRRIAASILVLGLTSVPDAQIAGGQISAPVASPTGQLLQSARNRGRCWERTVL